MLCQHRAQNRFEGARELAVPAREEYQLLLSDGPLSPLLAFEKEKLERDFTKEIARRVRIWSPPMEGGACREGFRESLETGRVLLAMQIANYRTVLIKLGKEATSRLQRTFWEAIEKPLVDFARPVMLFEDGLLLVSTDQKAILSLAIEILRSVERHNRSVRGEERIHLLAGLHRLKQPWVQDPSGLPLEMLKLLKLHAVQRKDLLPTATVIPQRPLSSTDRLLLTEESFQEVKNLPGVPVQFVGTFQARGLPGSNNRYEVFWRDPLENIRLGIIRRLGRFEILEELHGGGLYVTYKARDPLLRRMVILKALRTDLPSGFQKAAPSFQRFLQETKPIARLNHPNMAVIYDVGQQADFLYIVREYVVGNDLGKILSHGSVKDTRHLLGIILQVCKALDYAHKMGVIHRNIKPSNIMVPEEGEVRLMDFDGPSLWLLRRDRERTDVESLSYRSPEHIFGPHVDERSDIFSVGVILYECLTGIRPFYEEDYRQLTKRIRWADPTPPSIINENLPKIYDEITAKALAKYPEQRYQRMGQLVADLQRALRERSQIEVGTLN